MNNALLYLGGILITALALLFAVPRFVDWNSYRGVFEEEASRILGREVRVGGAVNVRLVPVPFVSFEKLRIADTGDEGGNSIIRVESFTMWLSIPPLLRGALEAHKVELRRPVLNLAVNSEGSGNWRSLALTPGVLPFAPSDVALQQVAVSDGAVIVHTQDRGELARFDAINGEFSAEALDGPFKFRGTVNWNDSPRNVRIATAKIDGSGQLRFKAAVDVIAGANSYVLEARLNDLKTTPKLTGDLTAKLHVGKDAKPADRAAEVTLEPEPERKAADVPGSDSGSTGAPDATDAATKEIVDASPGPAPQPVPATNPAADAAQASKAFELKAKVTGTALGVALDDVAVSLEAGTTPQLITGQAKFDWTNRTRLDVNLASRWLDLDGLAKTGEASMPLDAIRSYFEMVAAALPAEADTNALLEFDQLTLAGEPISNVHLAASRSGGPLEIKGARADLPGGVRLELDGVLTPGQRVPDLDGALFVSGKNLMRFLAWGLGKEDLKRERTDGPFSLDGRFKLGDGTLALTDASAVFQGTPLEGELKLALGERRRLAVAISGPRIDVAQFKGGLVDLNHLRQILFGADATDESASASTATTPFDPAGGDLALDLKVAELIDGDRRLKDVDADIRVERGKLSIPRLKFATAEGLYVEAEGEASDVPANPKGAIRGLISAPDADAANALLSLFDDGTGREELDRLAGLAPFRVAGTLKLAGGPANASTLSLDGKLNGGRISATLHLDGGRAKWRASPLDLEAAIDAPDVAQLIATLFDAQQTASSGSEPPKAGRVIIKAAGVPADGLLSFAEATADGFAMSYRGDVKLPEAGPLGLAGEVKLAVPDARTALSLAGIAVAGGAADIPIRGTINVLRESDVLTLESEALALGASTVSGRVALTARGEGRKTIDATLKADKATFSTALAPLLSDARQPDMLASAEAASAPPSPRSAPDPEASEIWPERAFDLAVLDRVDGKIAVTVDELGLERGLTIGNAELKAQLSPQGVKVTRFAGDAVGGKLQSEIDISRAPAGVGLKGSLRIDIAGKSAGPGETQAADGGVAFSVKFSGRALSPAAAVAGLAGEGEVTVGDVTLAGNSPAAVGAVARAALTGQGPRGGAPLADAMRAALKEGEVKLGKVSIPVEISDGALKLKRVQIEMPEGRSSFVTAVELQTLKIDSEWQVEPKLDKSLAGAPDRALLPPVTVVYTGKLSELAALEPQVSADALERELVVRKMEIDVRELERLRKLDEERARQDALRRKEAEERARVEAERQRALEEDQPPNAVQREDLAPPPAAAGPEMYDNSVRDPGDGIPIEQDLDANAPPPVAAPSPTAAQRPAAPRRKKPPEEEWRPFQITPY